MNTSVGWVFTYHINDFSGGTSDPIFRTDLNVLT